MAHVGLALAEVDELALARAVAIEDGGHCGEGRGGGGDGVGVDGALKPSGVLAQVASQRGVAGDGVCRAAQPLVLGVGPVVAKEGHGDHDDVLLDLLQVIVAQAKPGEDPGSVVIDDHVADGGKSLEEVLALWVAQVQCYAQLVAIDAVVESDAVPGLGARRPRHTVGVSPHDRRRAVRAGVRRVELAAAAEALYAVDLDDLCAKVSQQGAGVRPGPNVRGVEDSNALKWQLCHVRSLLGGEVS